MGTFEAPAGTTLTTKCADWQQQARAQGTVSPRTSLRNSSETTQQYCRNRKKNMCVAGRPQTQAWRTAGEERPALQCPLPPNDHPMRQHSYRESGWRKPV